MFPLIHRISFQKAACTLPGALAGREGSAQGRTRSEQGIMARQGDAQGCAGTPRGSTQGGCSAE